MSSETRTKRHKQLMSLINSNPLMTDEEIADALGVSLSTVRLDRAMLSVPEVRKRMRSMAERAALKLKSLRAEEVVGELLELEPNEWAVSILSTAREFAFRHTNLVGDHYIYAQASSLAIATIGEEMVLTGTARLRYRQPAYVGEKILARSKVGIHKGNKYVVSVHSKVGDKEIFVGRFIVVAKNFADNKGTEAKAC